MSDYFYTDWAAMTAADWVGTVLTVVIFVVLSLIYFHVFRPRNKERLESYKHIPFDNDGDFGEHHGGN